MFLVLMVVACCAYSAGWFEAMIRVNQEVFRAWLDAMPDDLTLREHLTYYRPAWDAFDAIKIIRFKPRKSPFAQPTETPSVETPAL